MTFFLRTSCHVFGVSFVCAQMLHLLSIRMPSSIFAAKHLPKRYGRVGQAHPGGVKAGPKRGCL